ncbi:MAG: creatinine amidohydrolase [Chloroflexi bacterium]|nr:MAG: creatinine amidohydrolase [Chloroflexota bacterium]MBA4376173.1 creatininase [Anaerolinea sp.]
MRLAELNWMEIEGYLKKDDRLMMVLGATEQHGYISIGADVKIPQSIADAASQQSGVLVAPPLNFGCSSYFTDYPGTMSLRVKTLVDVVEDIVRSVHHQGFKRLVIVNGHGGNKPAKVSLGDLVNELEGLKMSWYDWWEAPNVSAIAEKHGLHSYHASWIEAFPFVRTANMPQGEKRPFVTNRILSSSEVKDAIGDGVYGGPYQVDEAIMGEIFAAALKDVLFLLQFVD